MLVEVLVSFPFIVGISFLVVILIYWAGGRISRARIEKEAESQILYASGEEPPHHEPLINLERFVIYVIYFFIFDILAFLIVTSFEQTSGATIMYAGIILTAVLFLVPYNWRREEVYG
jgi:NADH:ubiquinone oxidoreductase subunit 3 (subunit A)